MWGKSRYQCILEHIYNKVSVIAANLLMQKVVLMVNVKRGWR